MNKPLMPKATAVWLVENTALTFDQIADFCGLHMLEVQAIADAVVERLKADKIRPHHVEGYQFGRWVLLDYGDFVVHVFDDSTRAFYALEKLWADAPDVTAEFVQ